MILSVGKTYRLRNGYTATITGRNGRRPYQFSGEVTNTAGQRDRLAYFTADGRYDLRETPSQFDVADEVADV